MVAPGSSALRLAIGNRLSRLSRWFGGPSGSSSNVYNLLLRGTLAAGSRCQVGLRHRDGRGAELVPLVEAPVLFDTELWCGRAQRAAINEVPGLGGRPAQQVDIVATAIATSRASRARPRVATAAALQRCDGQLGATSCGRAAAQPVAGCRRDAEEARPFAAMASRARAYAVYVLLRGELGAFGRQLVALVSRGGKTAANRRRTSESAARRAKTQQLQGLIVIALGLAVRPGAAASEMGRARVKPRLLVMWARTRGTVLRFIASGRLFRPRRPSDEQTRQRLA